MEKKCNKKINGLITILCIVIVCVITSLIFVMVYDKKENNNESDNQESMNENINKPYEFDDFYFIIGRLDENGPADFSAKIEDDYKYIKDEGIYINDVKLDNTENNDKIVLLNNFGIIVINKEDYGESYRFFNNQGDEINIISNNSDIHYKFITYDEVTKHPVAYYKCNDENKPSCNKYQKNEFMIYNDHVTIKEVHNDMVEMEYIEKVNISENEEENIFVDGNMFNIRYDNKNNSVFVNDEEFIDADNNIYYTNSLIILRYKSYGAYQYIFINSDSEEIDFEDRSSVYPLPYRYKEVYVENNNLYITSICISKECYANNNFMPVKLELNYNGDKVYIVDAN